MQTGKAHKGTTTGEARVRIEGGLAHFPGLAKERIISFADLSAQEREELTSLASKADFFCCEPSADAARPDSRIYTVGLTINGRNRDLRVAEPIHDPALATLVSVMRRLRKEGPAER